MRKKQKGFTLTELLVVMALIGLIAAMTINYTIRNQNRWTLRDTAREITSAFYQAKQRASRENAPVRIDFEADDYVVYWNKSGAWEQFTRKQYGEKVTVSKTPIDNSGFAISPSGCLLNPDTNAMYGMQTILLQSPRGSEFDSITIIFYPYGGINVSKDFK